ncbi:MAG: O-antigen ligase family protein [Pseudomonadota bacterium]
MTGFRPKASPRGHDGFARGRIGSAHPYTRLNDSVAWLLGVVVFLSAVPLGSNRPFWWLTFGLMVGLIASYYLIMGARLAPQRPLQMTQFRFLLTLAAMVPAYAVLQSIPIAGRLPEALLALPAAVPSDQRPLTISLQPDASLLGALRAIVYLTFVGLVIEISTRPKRIEKLTWILFFGVVAHAAWGLIALNLLGDIAIWGEKRSYLGVATGTFVNRNSYATFLGFGLVLGIALLMQRARGRSSGQSGYFSEARLEGLLLGGLLCIVLFALLSTQSRLGTFASLIGSIMTFLIMRAKGGVGVRRAAIEGLGLIAVLGVIGFGVVGSGLIERMVFVENEAATRQDIYRQVLGMIATRPWTGFGFDAFAPAFELFRAPPLVSEREVDLAHNSYLMLWSELGVIIGSIPLLTLAIAAALVLRKVIRSTANPAVPAAAFGALTLGAVHSLGDFSLEIPANVILLLALIGMAIATEPLGTRPPRNAQK